MSRYTLGVNTDGHYFSPVAGRGIELRNISVPLAGARRELVSARGIFSPDSLDKATAILLENAAKLPAIAKGASIIDVGCGWGPIALTLALLHPESTVTAVDINPHALKSTELNAERLGLTNVRVGMPSDVGCDETFDVLWSNPPIRIGKNALHELLARWISQLSPQGHASLVVGKNLGADSLAAWLGREFPSRQVSKAHSSKGFRLLVVE